MTFFSGQAALYSQAAAGFILTQSQPGQLLEGLGQVRSQLQSAGITDHSLTDFYPTIDRLETAVCETEPSSIQATQMQLARIVAAIPDPIWRNGTFSHMTPREQCIAYLEEIRVVLRPITGSRQYVLSASDEDKAFIRTLLGGITIFVSRAVDKSEKELAGMVEEVAAQIQDSVIQTFANQVGAHFPVQPNARLAPVLPETSTTSKPPSTLRSPIQAKAPATDTLSREEVVSTPSFEPRPPRLPYDYHPESTVALTNALYEQQIQDIALKIHDQVIDWPYDFVTWTRSLYLWAGEIAEIPSRLVHDRLARGRTTRGLRNNIAYGLRQLSETDTIGVGQIRRLLAPVAMALGKPVENLPQNWPLDMPNNLTAILVMNWDGHPSVELLRLRSVVTALTRIWTYSSGLDNEAFIHKKLRNVMQRFNRAYESDRDLPIKSIETNLAEIRVLFPLWLHPALDGESIFEYHEMSERRLPKSQEELVQAVLARIEAAHYPWAYDFVRWTRSLYRWTKEVEEIPTQLVYQAMGRGRTRKGLTTNISNGLKALANSNKIQAINMTAIRKHLGPTSVAVDHPMTGIPANWPVDWPNHLGKALIRAWDGHPDRDNSELRRHANILARIWKLSAGQPNEADILRILARLAGSLDAFAEGGRARIIHKIEQNLAAAIALFPKESRQQILEAGR